MNKIDFFSQEYHREAPRTDAIFGINDGVERRNGISMAYTTLEHQEQPWNAEVQNLNTKSLTFMPLDNNIVLHPTPNTTYRLCDGMLYDAQKGLLTFVELKVKGEAWIAECIEQLMSTIEYFSSCHDILGYAIRKAYAANRKHPCFPSSKKDVMQRFHNKTHFRLLIQNQIKIG